VFYLSDTPKGAGGTVSGSGLPVASLRY